MDQPVVAFRHDPANDNFLERQYFAQDRRGSIIALTDDAGVMESYAFGTFGVPDSYTSSTGNTLRFTGRRLDSETGLYYYRARMYSPTTGRFLQTDPIGYEDQMNLYAYVANDPGNLNDPSGVCSVFVASGTSLPFCQITRINYGRNSAAFDSNAPLYTGSVGLIQHALRGEGRAAQFDTAALVSRMGGIGQVIEQSARGARSATFQQAILEAVDSGQPQQISTFLPTQTRIPGVGRVRVNINGEVTTDGSDRWSFTGNLSIEPEPFDFNLDEPGARPFPLEMAAEIGAGFEARGLANEFDLFYLGSFDIYAEGPLEAVFYCSAFDC